MSRNQHGLMRQQNIYRVCPLSYANTFHGDARLDNQNRLLPINSVNNLNRHLYFSDIIKFQTFDEQFTNGHKFMISEIINQNAADFKLEIGDHVQLSTDQTGIIKYIGPTRFANGGEMIGLEMDHFSPKV
jgi:hypothetical protein